jgi:hypothetical protein
MDIPVICSKKILEELKNYEFSRKDLCHGNCYEWARNGTKLLLLNVYTKVSKFQIFLVYIESNFPPSPFSINKRKSYK